MALPLYDRFRRITSNQTYFPEIDGIRFLAIMLVVWFHSYEYFVNKTSQRYLDTFKTHALINGFFSKGDRGVELFFVLSGFILCLPFAQHYLNNGKEVALKKYYLRRVTRLEPPYIIAITGIFILGLAIHAYPGMTLAQALPHYFASLTYTHVLLFHTTPMITVVAWSLEVEIQFYVLAPLFFRVLNLPVVARRLLLPAAIAALVLFQYNFIHGFAALTILNMAQYFFMGILLADLYVSEVWVRVLAAPAMAAVAVILLAFIVSIPLQDSLPGKLAFPFLIGGLYIIVLRNPIIKNIFSIPLLSIVGGMCYTIYLVHYTLISALGRISLHLVLPGGFLPNLALHMALMSIVVIAVSSLYYLFIERPFMDKKWMERIFGKAAR
jgi:peptidoglycan/LPS O-acetylase OafA/YrhL